MGCSKGTSAVPHKDTHNHLKLETMSNRCVMREEQEVKSNNDEALKLEQIVFTSCK